MVLQFDGLFGEDKNMFPISPEDEQISKYAGARIIPTEPPSDTVTLTALEAALNTLELQAASAIIPGDYLEIKMDIFTDADGYLDTIDTGSTTATYLDDYYISGSSTIINRYDDDDTLITLTVNGCIKKSGFISNLSLSLDSSNSSRWAGSIIQSGSVLAAKNANNTGASIYINFESSDYIRMFDLGSFSIELNEESGGHQLRVVTSADMDTEVLSIDGAFFQNGLTYIDIDDYIIRTESISIPAGFGNFQIVAFRETTTGTGSITADISFNGGTSWQTDLSVNTNYEIITSGTSMIVELHLHGEDDNISECKGWGIQLWE